MLTNSFIEKELKPDEYLIQQKLKNTYPILHEIRKVVKDSVGETVEEWKYYGAKHGWVLKTFLKKRNLFFLIVYDGFFMISFIFGDKAVDKVLASEISEELKTELKAARKYAEGRGLPITVKDNSYIEDIRKLLNIKVEK
ncbi:MAG: DUF3788 family protein [Balneolaceae bacterium]|nr:DUF3788 family protein [Balneolaceae bacterium]